MIYFSTPLKVKINNHLFNGISVPMSSLRQESMAEENLQKDSGVHFRHVKCNVREKDAEEC